MSSIYICYHHLFYPSQEFENAEVAFVSSNIETARAWVDSFIPVVDIDADEVHEWRSIKEMKLDTDYCTKPDIAFFDVKFDVSTVPTVYTQE